ncbi:IclR family transcriptional regulator [Microbacterium sp. HD4P20]|uniref:IclR family transcriptional regulator n=1 Tax=Microbacterium sp. HD4P20 TaxID=2864874 RepID=UPI001C64033F|nr:IclR family transcriptional regulator [Microbacterium sp. HD4P20]MCP2635513.1 IclR family transcriptional regulator [Microbacterium sp. HD4P20]
MHPPADEAVGVLDRITAIFEAFDDEDSGLGVSELALRAGLPKSTVSRLVADLVRQRYLERDGRSIRLGLRLFELGQLAEGPHELRSAAMPVLAELRHATGATVHLAILEGHEMTYVAVMRGRDPLPGSSRAGGRVPLSSPLGRALLSHLSAADADAILAGTGSNGPGAPDALRARLADVRRAGMDVEIGRSSPAVTTVAAPVLWPAPDAAAAVAVCGPSAGLDVERTAAALRTATLAIQRRLAPELEVP